MVKTIAFTTICARSEYYNELYQTAEFNITLFENSDVFGAEYWLDIEGPGRLTQLTFTDKAKALRVYREECESKLDFV